MNYPALQLVIKRYAVAYIKRHVDEGYTYHNKEHALYVAKSALKIGESIALNDGERFVLMVAAWFHDTGFSDGPENHEIRSSELAKKYLSDLHIPAAVIDKIACLILATQIAHQPVNQLEEIIRDADLYHLGDNVFEKKNEQLYTEQEFILGKKISKKEWLTDSVKFLQSHVYHTSFGRLHLTNKKLDNLELLKSKLKEIANVRPVDGVPKSATAHPAEHDSKGIETFFQVASSNSQQLSSMADNKANILITVNSIIISAIISFYLRKRAESNYIYIPGFLILGTCLFSMICAILATRPKLSRGTFNPKELNHRQVNLLFFGNFYKMKIEKYTEGVLMMINDPNYLQNSLIKDVYYQGVVLGRKYLLLRIAYSIFMLGLILAVMAFFIVLMLRGTPAGLKNN